MILAVQLDGKVDELCPPAETEKEKEKGKEKQMGATNTNTLSTKYRRIDCSASCPYEEESRFRSLLRELLQVQYYTSSTIIHNSNPTNSVV